VQYNTLIIDGPYLAHKSYQAPYKLTTTGGRDATMIHSFIRSLNSFRKQFNPETIIIAWESHGTPSWRKEQYPAYKGTRGRPDEQFIYQLEDLQRLLFLFNVDQFYAFNNEADDVIASYVEDNSKNIVIFTSDKDIMQLVNEKCFVYDGKVLYDFNKVKEKFFVNPKQIPDLLAIAGDKADNIQGIDGFGFKKAAKILEKYKYIENISDIESIAKYKKMLKVNKKLTTLNKCCPLVALEYLNCSKSIEAILDKYELKKMKEKIGEYKLLGRNGGA